MDEYRSIFGGAPGTVESPAPGIYPDMTFDEYCKVDAVNNGRMKRMDDSPLHFLMGRSGETNALRIGRLVHAGKLEADQVPLRYAVMPEFHLDEENVVVRKGKTEQSTSKATNYYKSKVVAFREANRDKEIVTAKQYKEVIDWVRLIESSPKAVEFLNAPGPTEVAVFWIDKATGLPCKALIDKYMLDGAGSSLIQPVGITDLKTDVDGLGFGWSIWKYGYHRQSAHYIDGVEAVTGRCVEFNIVTLAKAYPSFVTAAPVDEDTVEAGRIQNREAMHKIAACVETGEWPAPMSPDKWRIPANKLEQVMTENENFDWGTV